MIPTFRFFFVKACKIFGDLAGMYPIACMYVPMKGKEKRIGAHVHEHTLSLNNFDQYG